MRFAQPLRPLRSIGLLSIGGRVRHTSNHVIHGECRIGNQQFSSTGYHRRLRCGVFFVQINLSPPTRSSVIWCFRPSLLNYSVRLRDRLYGTMATPIYSKDTPDTVKNAKGIHLITQSTPNGQKVQILLEELADLYGLEWTTTLINIMTNEQKKDWFLRINPNGRIPVIIDNDVSPPHPVMETSAELLYLSKFDTDHHFDFTSATEQSELLQWIFFWHGSGAPYQGNLNFFRRAENEGAIERFKKETIRVFGVLELQLSGKHTGQEKDYLAGNGRGKYSLADIATWAWVKNWKNAKLGEEEEKKLPHLEKWVERIRERPAVQRGTGEKYQQK